MLLALKKRLHWSTKRLSLQLCVPELTVRNWVQGISNPDSAARRLIWLVYMLHFNPRALKQPDAWFKWPGVEDTEADWIIRQLDKPALVSSSGTKPTKTGHTSPQERK